MLARLGWSMLYLDPGDMSVIDRIVLTNGEDRAANASQLICIGALPTKYRSSLPGQALRSYLIYKKGDSLLEVHFIRPKGA